MSDLLIRAFHPVLRLRAVAAIATEVCQEAARRHNATPAAACALGRGLLGAYLLATLTQGGERVTVQIQSSGPLRGLTVDAYDDGSIRGYPIEPAACADKPMNRRQRLADLLGRDGVLHVVRDVGLKERFQGQVSLLVSEVDEDLEAYLRQSEQIPSALGTELIFDADGHIVQAGGVLLQTMPDSPKDVLAHLREAQHTLRSGELYDLLSKGPQTPLSLLQLVFGKAADGLVVQDERPLFFRCRCDRGRVETMLRGLSDQELAEMILEGTAEVGCNFCATNYTFSCEELVAIQHSKQKVPN
ncbi:MAG TPA: Hsp33 family molecular chaperone HslO [Pseudomonadota bacterium]|nr:Hsp33 family molecular chaperone HslO [Pseudomonadota bacterium]